MSLSAYTVQVLITHMTTTAITHIPSDKLNKLDTIKSHENRVAKKKTHYTESMTYGEN